MGLSLSEVAQKLKNNNKVQLIYAFNGTGKTRLSRELKSLVMSDILEADKEILEMKDKNFLYYSAFTEDLFYWDNDLLHDEEPKLKIQPNSFTDWVLIEQGQDQKVIGNFQRYSNEKLTPKILDEYKEIYEKGKRKKEQTYTGVTFSFQRGNDEPEDNIKISKGEESNFIWCVFYSLLEQVIDVLNVAEQSERETDQFDKLEYIFIDDPVTSLDDNHLIQLAVDLAQLIKSSESEVRFIITTHNPLFYNVLCNEFGRADKRYNYKPNKFKKYRLDKFIDGTFSLGELKTDSPFSYHLSLIKEIEKAIEEGQLKKYHFNFIRNVLEKTATFMGYAHWVELLPKDTAGKINPYEARIINISSHSKHSGEEVAELSDDDKRVLSFLVKRVNDIYKMKICE